MRIVTQITEVTRSRSKVYLDNEFAFVLYKGELRHYKITQGSELSEEAFEEIMNTVLIKRAKLRSMALLKDRAYTERQLSDKLKQGFYPEPVIQAAIAYVKSYGYIDDARYALDYIEYHSEGRSRRRLEQDLYKKGLNKEEIQAAFENWEEQGNTVDESGQIAQWIKKKGYDVHTADLKEKQKMAAFLFRKGFNCSLVQKMLNCDEFL